MPKVSVCIPTYDYVGGGGDTFLQRSLEYLTEQTSDDFEVVVSDQSDVDNIKKCVESFSSRLDIKYFQNEKGTGMSHNTNNCIENSCGELIKPIFQDDFVFDYFTIETLIREHDKLNKEWYSFKYNHYRNDGGSDWHFSEEENPYYNHDTLLGVNRLSSPTAIAFTNKPEHRFDNAVCMAMDCDFYYRMYEAYGEPHYMNDKSYVSMTLHSGQSQKNNNHEVMVAELDHLIQKHNLDRESLREKNFPFKQYLR